MKKAFDIIRTEHKAIAAVLTSLQAYVEGVEAGKFEVDFKLLEAMVQYLTEVPDQVHHPKEDKYLFAALRRRRPEIAPVLDDLEDEHHNVGPKWYALAEALDNFRRAGPAGVAAFRAAVATYFKFQWDHMSKEETQVLPLARTALTAEDWAAIDAAFAANDNPWEGPAGKYRQLFTRIVTLAPAPIGVGDGHH
jgi:branched-chain amino acid transport system ATP-binding protein